MSNEKEPASEAKERCSARTEAKECEYYLDGESIVYECICGNIEIGGKIYYPEDKVNPLKEEITRLKVELERERDAAQQLSEYKEVVKELLSIAGHAMHEDVINKAKKLIN